MEHFQKLPSVKSSQAISASPESSAAIVKKFPGILSPGPQQSTPTSVSPTFGETWDNLSSKAGATLCSANPSFTMSTRYTHHTQLLGVPCWSLLLAQCWFSQGQRQPGSSEL